MSENPVWTERFRPRKIEEVILPERLKREFRSFVERGSVPNLILSGPPGVGKTTVALAMLDELGHDVYVINGSLRGNIDTLRNEIMDFASSVSFTGARKTVLIDEADYLNQQSTQPALRNFMEEFSGNCGFVLTCNFKSRIIEPLRSRCSVIDFHFERDEVVQMAGDFFKRVRSILDQEGVAHEPAVVGQLIKRHFPDCRRVLNELQRHSLSGPIDTRVLTKSADLDLAGLISHMRTKDFTGVRRWVAENSDVDPSVLFRKFYDHARDVVTDDSVPQLVLTIGEYQYKSAHVADQEINTAAFLIHIMASCSVRPE